MLLDGSLHEEGHDTTGEARIVWAERGLDLLALALGLALLLAAPAARVHITLTMLVVLGGAVLLVSGLARDLARLALEGRPAVTAPDSRPGELRLCLESALGLGAVAAGLGWRFWSAGPPVDLALGGLVLALAVVATFGHHVARLYLPPKGIGDPLGRPFPFPTGDERLQYGRCLRVLIGKADLAPGQITPDW